MTVRRRRVAGVAAGVAAVVVAGGLAGCGGGAERSAAPSTSAALSASARLDTAVCRQTPSSGRIDRTGTDLRFHHGHIRIAMTTPSPTMPPSPPPGPALAPGSGIPGSSTCFGFPRWGPADPAVPPDSLLFVFKGAGSDGAQIEFLAGDLTGGVLPPIGSMRPRVGPLTGPINAQIGVATGGAYYHSTTCALTLAAVSSTRTAGHFTCPAADRLDTNPLAPEDDVAYDDPASESEGAAASSAAASSAAPSIDEPSAAGLSGWFEVSP